MTFNQQLQTITLKHPVVFSWEYLLSGLASMRLMIAKSRNQLLATLSLILMFAVSQANGGNLSITTFTGADIGEGLDLDGVFTHAVNVGGPEYTIRDVTFAADTGAPVPDISIAGTPSVSNPLTFNTQPQYGGSSADDDLEEVMHTIRFVNITGIGDGMTVDLADVETGKPYKLQMMFSENRNFGTVNDRRFGVAVEGNVLDTEFGVLQTHGPWTTAPTIGALITYTFIASDDTINIELTGIPGHTFDDDNPILQALTLEIPEPATYAIAVATLCLLPSRRR